MRALGMKALALGAVFLLASPALAKKCKQDAVQVGALCVDKYEASVWEIAPSNTALIKSVRKGKIGSAADLSGATQRGVSSDDYGAGCPDTGNGCKDSYAVSVAGVTPSSNITWFQAAAACRNAGKRLLTNQEWQVAALGTPDPGTDNSTTDCNITSTTYSLPEDPVNTGSRSLCVSDSGAFDMVGNLWEWVADWGDRATGSTSWPAAYGTDVSAVGGDGTVHLPGALRRGGDVIQTTGSGVFAIAAGDDPSAVVSFLGFRCGREP